MGGGFLTHKSSCGINCNIVRKIDYFSRKKLKYSMPTVEVLVKYEVVWSQCFRCFQIKMKFLAT